MQICSSVLHSSGQNVLRILFQSEIPENILTNFFLAQAIIAEVCKLIKDSRFIGFNCFELQERCLSKLKAYLSVDDLHREYTEIHVVWKIGGGDWSWMQGLTVRLDCGQV